MPPQQLLKRMTSCGNARTDEKSENKGRRRRSKVTVDVDTNCVTTNHVKSDGGRRHNLCDNQSSDVDRKGKPSEKYSYL